MDKREQVFVSSTFIDLSTEREKVIQGLLEADCFPAGMELFPAADDEKFDLIKGVIDDSDYYLLILGGRYGSEDDETELSYTEMEYDYAVKSAKPIIAFVHGEPDKIAVGQTDKNDEKAAKLNAFRDKVEKNKVVKLWTNGDQLPGFVAQSLMRLRKVAPAVGWVRGDQAMSPEDELKMSEMALEIERLRNALKNAETKRADPIENVASGSDEVSFDVDMTLSVTDTTSDDTKLYKGIVEVPTTWDALLSALGPRLLLEAEELRLREALREHLVSIVEADPSVVDLDSEDDELSVVGSSITDDQLHTVVVQFSALEFIEPGRQKRGVQDRGRYWTLTPSGSQRLMALRAIRKTADPA